MNLDQRLAAVPLRHVVRRSCAALGAVAVAAATLVAVAPGTAQAMTVITVDSIGDSDDTDGDGVCDASGGGCTLRAAIRTANTFAEQKVTIEFEIGGPGATGLKTIDVNTALPPINNGITTGAGITIDGFSQPDSTPNSSTTVDNAVRRIEVTGDGPNLDNGFTITGRNNVIRGLVINEFNEAVRIQGKNSQNSGDGNNNQVIGNMIGLEPDGSLVANYGSFNGNPCVSLVRGAGFNRIGTPAAADRNTISGCYEKGIYMENPNTFGNKIQNNIIGMDPTVTQRRSNQFGIDINGGVKNTTIGVEGGVLEGANVLSGNRNSAVEISHDPSTTGNNIIGNFIGTDFTGDVHTSQMVTNDYAIRLEGRRDANLNSCDENSGNSIVADNVIVGAGRGGILVDKGFINSTIRANDIGVTRDGDIVGNTGFAVRIVSASNNIIVRDNDIAGGSSGIQVGPRSVDPASTRDCQTDFNTFTDNRITSIANNGIDLFPYGSPTVDGAPSPFVNEGIPRPTISSNGGVVTIAALEYVEGAYEACGGCIVELFSTTRPTGQFGLSDSLVATQTAPASGVVEFTAPSGGWPARVTATATTPGGSTSELSVTIVPTVFTPPAPPPEPPAPPTALAIVARAEPPSESADRIGNRVVTS